MDEFPKLVNKKHSTYLVYISWGRSFSALEGYIKSAEDHNVALQIALQPRQGLNQVKNNSYLRQLAKKLDSANIPIFLRFANEMNGKWVPWYTDANKYIEKFKKIYNDYAHKKPVFISESGIAYKTKDGIDKTKWASYQIKEFYSYLPMLYPAVKGVFWFDSNITSSDNSYIAGFDKSDNMKKNDFYQLSANPKILNTYRESVNKQFYLSEIGQGASFAYLPVNKLSLPPKIKEISVYIKTHKPFIDKVEFFIENEKISTDYKIPWQFVYDFSKYENKSINIKIKAYYQGKLICTKSINSLVNYNNFEKINWFK